MTHASRSSVQVRLFSTTSAYCSEKEKNASSYTESLTASVRISTDPITICELERMLGVASQLDA